MPRARNEPARRALLPFSASFSLEHAELVSALYTSTVIERRLRFAHMDGWTTRAKSVDLEGERLFTSYAQLEGAEGAKPSDSFAAE